MKLPYAARNSEVREEERATRQHRDTIGANVVRALGQPRLLRAVRLDPRDATAPVRHEEVAVGMRENAFGPLQVLADLFEL